MRWLIGISVRDTDYNDDDDDDECQKPENKNIIWLRSQHEIRNGTCFATRMKETFLFIIFGF